MVVTRRGAGAAVLVPMEEWRRLEREGRPNIKELLLGGGARFDDIAPTRGGLKYREGLDFGGPDDK